MNKVFDVLYAACLIAFGIVTIFFLSKNGLFVSVYSLKVMEVISSAMPTILGVVGCISGLAILIPKFKIMGYIIATALTGSIVITSFVSLWAVDAPHSPTLFLFIPVVLGYAGRAFLAVNEKYNPENLILHEDKQDTGKTAR